MGQLREVFGLHGMAARAWDTVIGLVKWLDENSPLPPETNRLMRVMKLSEEVGETAQA